MTGNEMRMQQQEEVSTSPSYRWNICQNCPNVRQGANKQGLEDTCIKCGCGIYEKVNDISEHCPIGKW